jgi:hypothetical protein
LEVGPDEGEALEERRTLQRAQPLQYAVVVSQRSAPGLGVSNACTCSRRAVPLFALTVTVLGSRDVRPESRTGLGGRHVTSRRQGSPARRRRR